LSVIAGAKVSHFEILCRVYGFVPTVEMDLFAFINHADPTKVRIREREVAEGEVPLLQVTRGRVVPLAGVNDQGNGEHIIDVGGIDVVANDEVQAIVANKPQRVRKKRKVADGASGSGLPPKKLKDNHGTFGIGANTGGKSVSTLQSFLKGSTFPVEVGVTAVATVPFVTSSVTPDFISRTGLRTRHPAKRFVFSSDSSHDLNVNATDDEVTSVIMSSMQPPPVLTAAVATTIIAGATFAPVHKSDLSARSFYVSQDMDPETLRQLWGIDYEQLFTEFNVGTARQVCFSAEIRMRLEHELRGRQSFEGKCAMQANWLKEMDVKIASLKAQLSLKEAEATEAIHLRVLEGHIVALESAVVSKDVELASSNAQVAKVEAMQDEYVNVLSDRVASIDSDLMEMALHMDEEFYPHGLAAGIDYGKVRRSLVDVSAYNPFVEADYVAAINALRAMDFPFLA
nr:hypothetical protein [Tanacetum cinerariifolium]